MTQSFSCHPGAQRGVETVHTFPRCLAAIRFYRQLFILGPHSSEDTEAVQRGGAAGEEPSPPRAHLPSPAPAARPPGAQISLRRDSGWGGGCPAVSTPPRQSLPARPGQASCRAPGPPPARPLSITRPRGPSLALTPTRRDPSTGPLEDKQRQDKNSGWSRQLRGWESRAPAPQQQEGDNGTHSGRWGVPGLPSPRPHGWDRMPARP